MIPDQRRKLISRFFKNNRLYRIGTIGDGSCYIHSIFRSINYKNYNDMSVSIRKKFMKKERVVMAKNLSIQNWKNLGDGANYNILVSMKNRSLIESFHREMRTGFIFNEVSEEDIKQYKEITSIITRDVLQNDMDISGMDIDVLTTMTTIKINDNVLADKWRKILKSIQEIIDKKEYIKFICKLGDSSEWIDDDLIGFVTNNYSVDVFMINAHDGLPRNWGGDEKGRDSIIIYYIDDTHFEVIGRKDDDGELQTVFKPDDDLIRKFIEYRTG
jgi:hypothetical protein